MAGIVGFPAGDLGPTHPHIQNREQQYSNTAIQQQQYNSNNNSNSNDEKLTITEQNNNNPTQHDLIVFLLVLNLIPGILGLIIWEPSGLQRQQRLV
jgi:hypothetical protein